MFIFLIFSWQDNNQLLNETLQHWSHNFLQYISKRAPADPAGLSSCNVSVDFEEEIEEDHHQHHEYDYRPLVSQLGDLLSNNDNKDLSINDVLIDTEKSRPGALGKKQASINRVSCNSLNDSLEV